MAKTRQQKEESVNNLVNKIKESKSVVFANFQGLKVSESEELRGQCREQNVEYLASKKSLVKKALAESGFEVDTKVFEGGIAAVFGVEDEVAPAQLLHNFAKKHEVVTFYGGVLEGKYIDGKKVEELAKLPSKQQLLGQLVGTINAPVSGFVNVLAGNLRGLVSVLNNISAQKGGSA